MSSPAPLENRSSARVKAVAGLLVGLALAMRGFAVTRDLFVDEIRSLFFADWASSALAVFSIAHDNNHLLNTLWLHMAGPGQSALLYRLPALLAGLGSLAVGVALGWRRSRDEALVLLALLGTSNLIVQYSTEARGYALAILAQLVALYALERGLESRGRTAGPREGPREWRWCLLFQASVMAGLLAHLSFAVAYVALAGYQVARSLPFFDASVQSPGGLRALLPRRVEELLLWNALPVVFAGALWLGFARGMQIGGAPETQTLLEILGTAANALGLANQGSDRWIGAGLAIAIAGVALTALARSRDPRLVLYGTGLVAAPALALLVRPTSFVQPRYFLPSVVFFLLLFGGWAAGLSRSSLQGRRIAIALVSLFVVANIVLTIPLWRDGQGEYARGMALMARESNGIEITLGSERPAHDQIVFEYYASELPAGRQLRFVTARDWPPGGPEWLSLIHFPDVPVKRVVRDERGNTYRWRETFSASPRGGGGWLLYQNAPRAGH